MSTLNESLCIYAVKSGNTARGTYIYTYYYITAEQYLTTYI